jgi:hypothetical protein
LSGHETVAEWEHVLAAVENDAGDEIVAEGVAHVLQLVEPFSFGCLAGLHLQCDDTTVGGLEHEIDLTARAVLPMKQGGGG